VAKKIKRLSQNENIENRKNRQEWKLITGIKNELTTNKLVITKADKGKTLVILTQEEYKRKINNFIQDNQYTPINNNPTQQYHKIIKHTLEQCSSIKQEENVWKYTNMNPQTPNLYATIKLHKPDTPIRPAVNWKDAPAYELAKQLTKTLHNHLNLLYTYNVSNSIHLITDLKTIQININTRICSFDIENMYTNIPRVNTINIISNIIKTTLQSARATATK
jgi:hypothetical protein